MSAFVLLIGKLSNRPSAFGWLGVLAAVVIGLMFPRGDARVLALAYVSPALVLCYNELPGSATVLIIVAPFLALVAWIAIASGQQIRALFGR